MRKSMRETWIILLFLVFVLAVWSLFILVPQPKIVSLTPEPGPLDASEYDFSDTIYYYQDYWENYPGQLYTPADFTAGLTDSPTYMRHEDYETYQYATHRMEVKLPPGVIYALSMKSPDYAMRLYINGQEAGAVGSPGATVAENIPRVSECTFYFMPTGEVTTIIAQVSNWVHKEGAYSPKFYFGTAENIQRYEARKSALTFLMLGCLITAFLYHLGLFVLNRKRKEVLVFALCCALLALVMNKLPQLFFPEYNWFAVFRLEYVTHFGAFAMLALFLQVLFPRLLHKPVMRAYYALAALGVALSLVLPTVAISVLLVGFDGISLVMIGYVMVRLGMALREKKPQNVIAFVGILFICLLGINDILYTKGVVWLGALGGQSFTTPIAMAFFVFCFAVVLSLEYAETERAMVLAQQQVLEAEARYLEAVGRLQPSPSRALPAEFKLSAREMDVLWLLLDGKTRAEIAATLNLSAGTVNTYCSRIYKKTGAVGFSELAHIFGLPNRENP